MKTTLNSGRDLLLPRGAPLVDNMVLNVADVELMLENLREDEFTGIVQLKLGSVFGFFVMREGTTLRALESTSRGELLARLPARLYALLAQRATSEVSSFVLAPSMVSVLSAAFGYGTPIADKRVERKQISRVLDDLKRDNQTGFIRLTGPDGVVFLLISDGTIITERFADKYGDITCSADQVSAILDHVYENGSRVLVRSESTAALDSKTDEVEEDLARIRQLQLKKASALFRSSEEVKLSEEIFREWGLDPKKPLEVELETSDGRMFTYRCKSGSSRLGVRVEVHSNMLKEMNASEADLVNVRPIV